MAAREAFSTLLEPQESAELLEGLGWAGYGLDDAELTFHAREAAHRLYREAGRPSDAARVAAWLAADCLEFRGEPAVASGWLQLARRLLDDLDPGPDHGWLAVHEGAIAFGLEGDTDTARRLGARAAELGRERDVRELEMVGLGLEGVALVNQGAVGEGMRRLDEASATALSGQAKILVCVGWACCYLIYACEYVRDYDRAKQWCDRVSDFCARHDIAPLLGVCRTHHAAVLTWQGEWDAAEAELNSAIEGLTATRPPLAGDGVVRLAELRRRQGRLAEAERLLAEVEEHPAATLGLAALALDRGEWGDAVDLAERYLRQLRSENKVERAAGLELLVRAQLACDRPAEAALAARSILDIAESAGTDPLRAAAAAAEGGVAGAEGRLEDARRSLEDAVDLYLSSGAPFETAEARLALAETLRALGRETAAERERARSLEGFRALDARTGLARAEAPATVPRRSASPAEAGLTARELEVLRLVSDGLSNAEIASRLVLSEHTVHRHVSNVLQKLRVSSRAAAVAYAARQGLLEGRAR